MNRKLSILIYFICLVSLAFGQDAAQSQFEKANQAYERNDFMGAIAGYEALVKEGQESPELFYNLGNSYLKNNDLGRAILNYKKSLRLESNDHVINNLQVAQSQQPDELSSVGQTPRQWWDNFVSVFSSTTWGVLTLIMFWLAIAGFIFWHIGTDRTKRKKGFFSGIVLTILTALLLLFGYSKYQLEQNSRQAILIQEETKLHASADDSSEILNTIHAGLELTLLDEIGDWYQVRLINGEKGWLPKASLERY